MAGTATAVDAGVNVEVIPVRVNIEQKEKDRQIIRQMATKYQIREREALGKYIQGLRCITQFTSALERNI